MDFFKTPRTRKAPRTNKYSNNYGYYSHSEDTDSNSEETYSNYSYTSAADESQEQEMMTNLPDVKLNSAWDFYYTRNDVENYEERLVYVATFETVKQFWALYHHIKLPAYLPQGCDYMVFRAGIRPEWEDSANRAGGRWLCEIDRAARNTALNSKWLETLLAIIGEQLNTKEVTVNGAVVQSRRKIDRISVWVDNAAAEKGSEIRETGYKYNALVKSSHGLKFQSHEANRRRQINGLMYEHVIY